ncbi:MAG: GIY-YIG nuclease family protein [Vampirovibrionales bacterium]|nr:GIY-YIG nuclease family protein [Vampirovibrionales bacterium]
MLEPPFLKPLLPPEGSAFYTYILLCADGTFYTGWTTDVGKRLKVHNEGKGAKYTRCRLPVSLIGFWKFETKSEAMKLEHWIKQLPRTAKQRFIQDEKIPLDFLKACRNEDL